MLRHRRPFAFIVLLVTLLVALLPAPPARAQADFGFSQRAEKRESGRWTLSEWLAQRDRNRMMDLWLSMNSPSPFEFMGGVSYLSTKTTAGDPPVEDSFTAVEGELRAYAQFVGLTVEYANRSRENFNDLSGMLNLRLLGNSLQNSALTLHVGQRVRTVDVAGTDAATRNLFGQISLQVYLSRYFGLDGFHRQYQPAKNSALDATVDGSLSEGGLFIDFKAVRLFGAWYQDRERRRNDLTGTGEIRREGIKSGIRLFY